ncbi:MAG TPA: TlpA disulfide reductase family protein [Polyangiaceae bacterium]
MRRSASALFALLFLACKGPTSAAGRHATPPDFELSALDGSAQRLSEHLGKDVVLIDFWATFCEPCLASMPHLDELYRKNKARGFVVLGVSIDGADSLGAVRREVQQLGISFPILLDSDTRVVALYNPKTTAPYSVLIDRSGRIVQKFEGYASGGSDELDRSVAEAVARGAP